MKAIFDGKRFDTDKATKLAEISHGNYGDFDRIEEALYKTPRSGAYFLAGEGGPRSRYAVSDRPGEWRSGEKITPLSRAEALAWAERNGLTDLLEAEFGDQITDA